MSQNMGNIDRVARFLIGAALIIMALTGTIGAWGWIGLILVGTSFIKFCPLYRIVGFKTCSDC